MEWLTPHFAVLNDEKFFFVASFATSHKPNAYLDDLFMTFFLGGDHYNWRNNGQWTKKTWLKKKMKFLTLQFIQTDAMACRMAGFSLINS